MSNMHTITVGGAATAAALTLVLGMPVAASADTNVSMEDSSGNSLSGTIDINDLENASLVLKGEGDWDANVQGAWVNLNDSNGSRVTGAIELGTASADGTSFEGGFSFNSGVLQEGETYTFTVEYRDVEGNAIGYGEYTFTVGSSKGSGDEPSTGTGGGTGGGDGTGDGDGSGSGSGDGTGDGASSSGSASDGDNSSGGGWGGSSGWGDWGSWGGSSSVTVPSEGSTSSAGNAGTSSDPVIEAPVGGAAGEAEVTQEPSGDTSLMTPESTQPAVESPQESQAAEDSTQSSLQEDSQETPAAAAAATKGGGGGDDGPTPKEEQETPGEVDPAAQEAVEGAQDGTVLAKLGEVYSLFTQQRKPVALQVELQPSFSVTGIPWLLAAMLAVLLLAGPAGVARRFAGYRLGLSSSTRLGAAAPAASGPSAGSSPEPPRERRDA